jgi:hypothetical protein
MELNPGLLRCDFWQWQSDARLGSQPLLIKVGSQSLPPQQEVLPQPLYFGLHTTSPALEIGKRGYH